MNRLKEPLEMYIDALDPENDEDPESYDPEGLSKIYYNLHNHFSIFKISMKNYIFQCIFPN